MRIMIKDITNLEKSALGITKNGLYKVFEWKALILGNTVIAVAFR